MEITLDVAEPNSIKSYDNKSITIGNCKYQKSVIVSKDNIQSTWPVHAISELSIDNIQPLLLENPEIIIIGHSEINIQIPVDVLTILSKQRIGIESMSVGAACRTFNLLLTEQRSVVFGYIIKD